MFAKDYSGQPHMNFIPKFGSWHTDCLGKPWQTALSKCTIMLAFNFYDNWMPGEYLEDCSPSALFDNYKIRKYLLIGVVLRYNKK